jgi:two-component system response regulator HydG
MTAQAAGAGGADFLMVLSAGHYRLQGCSSMAALLPYADANALTWQLATENVVPRVGGVPVFLGVCAQDPHLNWHDPHARLGQAGLAGITNFPSVGFIDGQFREALEEAGLGYDCEVKLLAKAHRDGWLTIAFCFTAEEALAMSKTGVDILCLDLGFAEWRSVAEAEHTAALDRAAVRVEAILGAVKKTGAKPFTVLFGGPVGTPRDYAQVSQNTDVQGYVGGSTIERFPAEPLITQTMHEFKLAAATDRRGSGLGTMIGQSQVMKQLFETLRRVADSDSSVLIVGESGTGKELAAHEIHRLSPRRSRPLVCWNCASLTETLAMSELFGHERGAFTGATSRHLGKFELANYATLFMDEVTDLSASVQASLLRVLQEREIVRVGGETTLPVDVRLIASTNRDVPELIRTQRFRLDLYYRVSTIVLRIPPLRERREDIPLLVRELIHAFSRQYGCPAPEVPRSVLAAFQAHAWPGNIRELRNAVERCFILGRGERFRVEWLNDLFRLSEVLHAAAPQDQTPPESLASHRGRARTVVETCGGSIAAAARQLHVTRKTLYGWLDDAPSA